MNNAVRSVNPIVTAFVVTLCVVTIVLILTLPFDSLVVDLVYQGF
jgi:hypothetical protein